jgi:hypothetical protein
MKKGRRKGSKEKDLGWGLSECKEILLSMKSGRDLGRSLIGSKEILSSIESERDWRWSLIGWKGIFVCKSMKNADIF